MSRNDDPPSNPTLFDRPPTSATVEPKRSPRFRTVREIARGGMGRVLEAIDLELGRTVAIKEVLSTHPDARRRFEREIAITARLEHPSIVPLYDAGRSPSGDPFYVMRKLTGAPLDRVIQDATTLDRRLLLLPNLLAVADAVAHAHGRGVLHRDLKPSNVLVGDLGDTVVIDWGLAKIVDEADEPTSDGEPLPGSSLRTVAGAVIGTPGFMAPEQVTGDPVDARSDVYALGACLYYMLAGMPPIAGGSATEVLQRTIAGEVTSLADSVPGVPSELVTIVDKAMARDPRRRYLDAGGFSEDLRRFLGGQLLASHRYGWRQQLVRWFRRRRALVIAIAAGVVLTTTVAVVSLRRILAEQDRAEAAAARERDRADDLVITQAQAYLDNNPTLAVATLAQLRAESPRWNELAPTIAEARVRGVGVGYPGHGGKLTVIESKPADDRVLTSGNGEVWLDDLGKRTATRLVDHASVLVRARWCGEVVVVVDRDGLTFVDPRSRQRTRPSLAAAATSIATAAGVLVISDASGHVVALDLAAGATTPVDVPVGHAVSSVESSRSGTWLVVYDATGGAEIFHRTGRLTWERGAALVGEVHLVSFDAKERRLAYVTGSAVGRDAIELELPTLVERRRWPKLNAVALGYAGDALVAQTIPPGEFRELDDGGATRRRGTFELLTGHSFAAFGDFLVALETSRRIAITLDTARITLVTPLEISSIDVHGHFLVGTSPSALVVWDLDDSVPAHQRISGVGNLEFTSPDRLVTESRTSDGMSELVRYDIHAQPFAVGRGEPLGSIPLSSRSFVLGNGAVGAYDMAGELATLVDPSVQLAGTAIAQIASIDRDTVVIATSDGKILRRGRTGDPVELGRVDGHATTLVADAGWIAARTVTGVLWRRDPAGRVTTAHDIGPGIAFAGDTTYASRDADLVAWSTGEPVVVATFQLPIGWLRKVRGDRIAVETGGGGLALFDPTTRAVRPVLPTVTNLAYARDAAVAVGQSGNAVVAIDLVTGDHWPILDSVEVQSGGIAISPDGHTVIVAERVDNHLTSLFRVAIPSPANLRSWAQTATNAAAPTTVRGGLEFRPLPPR